MVTTQPPATELAEGMALKTQGHIDIDGRSIVLHGDGDSALDLRGKVSTLRGALELCLRAEDEICFEAEVVSIAGEGEFNVSKKAAFRKHVGVGGRLSAGEVFATGPVFLTLEEPPPGVKTDRVLIGDDGKLYRAD